MPLNMVVLIKQVPDTKNITAKAMNDDGTVNRSALPAIFNPEDLNALEMALSVRDEHGGRITVLCMGPPSAAEQLRDALMRGADAAGFLSDRAYAVADTLATAYALKCGIEKVGDVDIVFAGRHTYVAEILELTDTHITARRLIEGGYEIVQAQLPALLTVVDEANEPRARRAKLVPHYKQARTTLEVAGQIAQELDPEKGKPDKTLLAQRVEPVVADLAARKLLIPVWAPADIGADLAQCGKKGSPTQVKNIDFVTLVATDHKTIEPTQEGIEGLMHELIEDHVLD